MINKQNEIFTLVARKLREKYPNITILGEYVDIPSRFPCVTLEEVSNIPTTLDWGSPKYARVQYRVQVFSNKDSGRKAEAIEIYSAIDEILTEINLLCNSYITSPNAYNHNYQITAIHTGTINSNGYVFRR